MEDVKRVKKRYIPSHLSSAPPSRANAAVASQLPAAYIASKTYYDVVHHPPESTDWLNVLIAQAIMQYRDDAQINNRLILAVDEALNDGVRPNFLGPIHVTELNLGEEFPIFSSARIRPSDDIGSMRAEIDFEYNDQITLGIETQVILNWPRQAFAALPVSLVLSVVRFSGTLINPPETTTKPEKPLERYIAISSYSDFVLDMNVRSLIGSRTKLEDIPKLTDLITTKLRNIYIDKLVYPTFVKVKVPNMWEQRDKRTQERLEALTKEGDASTSELKAGAKETIEEFVKDIKDT
ncbi:ERMES complex subunit mmm1 [Apophysomyces sp. BC1034]|nr:ERMES complex subunit mmm1 [Apophysomyces sp. BC1021]KAG0187108.1 ERMES complex subunit mmm1 [Apophysomyces sp. BC1034]